MNPLLGLVGGDNIKPTVAMTSPAAGSVTGTITVSATAADNYGVLGVQFKLDGSNLGAEDTVAPYTQSLDTHTLTNGSHTITATARDQRGNTQTASVTFTVANVAPASGTLDFQGYALFVPGPDDYEWDRWNVRDYAHRFDEDYVWQGTGSKMGTMSLPANPDSTHYQMRVFAGAGALSRHEAGTGGNITTLSMYVNGTKYDVRIQDNDQGIIVPVNGGETIFFDRWASIDSANGSITRAAASYDFIPKFAS